MEEILLRQLQPIFPNLTDDVIRISIRHPSNNVQPMSVQSVFLSCIDDLLQLRTFTLTSAEQNSRTLSSDDEMLSEAAEMMEKRELISLNSSSDPNGKSKNIPPSELFTGTKDSVTNSKQSIPSTSVLCKTSSRQDSHYQTVKKEVIDSEDSSNDSLPDPCLDINFSKPVSVSATSSHSLSSPASKIQPLSSSLQRFKQKLSKSPGLPLNKIGSHSTERLTSSVEGQRTRFHSEPSQPIFSLNKIVKKTGAVLKPARFSPLKSTDKTVVSGLKKRKIIKPAVFSPKKETAVSSLDTKKPIIIKPATFSPKKDNTHEVNNSKNMAFIAKLFPNRGKIVDKVQAQQRGVYIKPATFSPDKGVKVVNRVPEIAISRNPTHSPLKSTVSLLSSSPNSTHDTEKFHTTPYTDTSVTSPIVRGDVNRKFKVSSVGDTKIISKENQQNSRTFKVTEALPPASLEDWKRVGIQGNSGLLDDEQTYRREILFKSGEVMGKIENERRKSLGRIQALRSAEGTSSKLQSAVKNKKGDLSPGIDKEDLPRLALLDTARRQRDDLRAQSVSTATVDNNTKQSKDRSKNNSGERSKKKQLEGSNTDIIIIGAENVTPTGPDIIDITESSQSSDGGSQLDPPIINLEPQAEFVDIATEPVDVQRVKSTNHRIIGNPGHPVVNDIELTNPMVVPDIPLKQNTVTAQNNLVAQSRVPTSKNQGQWAVHPPLHVDPRTPHPAAAMPPPPETILSSFQTFGKSPEEKLNDMVKEVLLMFPDVDPLYVKNNLLVNIGPEALNNVCNLLLENSNYPRVPKVSSTTVSSKSSPSKRSNKNFYEEFSEPVRSFDYRNICELLLQSEFKMISVRDIRNLAPLYNWHFAPMHKALTLIVKKGLEDMKSEGKKSLSQAVIFCSVPVGAENRTLKTTCLKCPRAARFSHRNLPPELSEEYEFVKERLKEEAKDVDMKIAQQINESEYAETGQLIECGCCYSEVPFDFMVQCYEGHLFCEDCLKNYANESVFGHGKTSLLCMSDGCDASFPKSQLDKALPINILSKYNDRVQEESINLAALDDLVRCPHCDFAALLDPGYKVFHCQNTSCMKETCRYCKEDWKEHFGKRCEEIEKKDEVSLRIKFEEKMAMAKIRTCHLCKAKFMKEEGCNKMTCKCGATMCYVCRKPNIDYKHFCQHLREPKKPCDKCSACFLWSKAEEDDERALAEIRKECDEARIEKGFSMENIIGAPDEPPAKKLKVN